VVGNDLGRGAWGRDRDGGVRNTDVVGTAAVSQVAVGVGHATIFVRRNTDVVGTAVVTQVTVGVGHATNLVSGEDGCCDSEDDESGVEDHFD
jgi:hypothetical protein